MKKKELIKILESIKGNPEILFWNGYVGDYMDFSLHKEPQILVKESVNHIYNTLVHYRCQERKSWEPSETLQVDLMEQAKRRRSLAQFEFPNEFVPKEEFREWYDTEKTAYLFSPKLRGKTNWDRMGDTLY